MLEITKNPQLDNIESDLPDIFNGKYFFFFTIVFGIILNPVVPVWHGIIICLFSVILKHNRLYCMAVLYRNSLAVLYRDNLAVFYRDSLAVLYKDSLAVVSCDFIAVLLKRVTGWGMVSTHPTSAVNCSAL